MIEQAAGFAAEALRLLSVNPTGQLAKWYGMKRDAANIFGDQWGQKMVESLCSNGIEDGFL